ncbi:hypothetical protein [Halobacterium sp. KA-6]|uniref:hypothetical protein n=1 Tax=Halobacterium sp. KA-6 TaxID=2896368 RepID=UPI001E55441F|nr:hypothetical protein [Halobacterium sp. KA-6]MCD2202679.1 hypothetical protein [Halobacterium sp. KA-6]
MPVETTTSLDGLIIDIDEEEEVVVKGMDGDKERLKAELNPDAPLDDAVKSLQEFADDLEETGSGRFWIKEE